MQLTLQLLITCRRSLPLQVTPTCFWFVMAIILLLFVLMVGVLYFRLHALPERFAHKKVQFEIVCVLALLAMFTHMHIFWVAGLLLALIDFPDFGGMLGRIAGSVEKIAGGSPREGLARELPVANEHDREPPIVPSETHLVGSDDAVATPSTRKLGRISQK